MPTYCCPKSVKACAVRFTRLQANGLPYDPLVSGRTVQGSGFAELSLSPDYVEGSSFEVRSPGGNLAVLHKDFDALRGFEVTLRLCGFTLIAETLGLNLLVDGNNRPGAALKDTLGDPCLDPWMVEVWSKNVGASCTDGMSESQWVHWLLPYTSHWTLGSDLRFDSDALEWEISGYARKNDWWFPAFPDDTFPAYNSTTGFPEDPAPPSLPFGVTADEWSLSDQETIRESGPLAWKCVLSLPEPLDDCAYMPCPGQYDSAVYGFDVYGVVACP